MIALGQQSKPILDVYQTLSTLLRASELGMLQFTEQEDNNLRLSNNILHNVINALILASSVDNRITTTSSEIYPRELPLLNNILNNSEYSQFLNDISSLTARYQIDKEIFYRANYDQLTGLPNRSLLSERFEQMLLQAHEQRAALLFIDLDCFKRVNDTLGHDLGDELLCQTAVRLQLCMRDTDTVARLGGDEFVIILPDINNLKSISTVADKIINCLMEPFEINKHTIHIGASIGISIYPDHGISLKDLMRCADLAMYQAKLAGRSTFQIYENLMDIALEQQLELESELHLAIKHGSLKLNFQPIIDITSNKLIGSEVVLIWDHPNRGLIKTETIFSIAERLGLSREIYNLVLEHACQALVLWRGHYAIDIPISINLTSVQAFYSIPLELIINCLKRYNLTPDKIILETTEEILLDDSNQAKAWIQGVKKIGLNINLDHFGTGYSSLARMKFFPVSCVKIDISVTSNVVDDPVSRALVEAILVITHSLNIKVIADGIENEQQLHVLRRMGCNFMQGYYFAPPVPIEDFCNLYKFSTMDY